MKKQPLEVSLLEDTTFPILYGGKVVGSGNVPHGDALQIVSIDDQAKQVTLSCAAYGGSTVTVPIAATDLLQRADALKEEIQEKEPKVPLASAQPPAATTPAAPATPEKTPQAFAPNAGASAATPSPQLPAAPEHSDQVQIHETLTNGFRHPGIGLTKAMLENVRAQIIAQREPWKSGSAQLQASGHSSLNYTMQGPFETVTRNPDLNRWTWESDMDSVYDLALMWYFTGNSAYAQKSHDILLAWATTQTSMGGQESGLDLGDFAYRYAGGAEILRSTWSGWTNADTTAVKNYFENVLWPGTSAGTSVPGEANKGLLNLGAGMAIAVFCDDTDKFNHVI
ncbi:MAG TPA: alginate lyase family protein, partial [Acidobacteriaceae bacterium]